MLTGWVVWRLGFISPRKGRKEFVMFGIWKGVCGFAGKVADKVLEVAKKPAAYAVAVVATAMGFGASEALASGGAPTVTFTPIVEFGDLFTSLTASLAVLVAGAVGLGLAIWVVAYKLRVVKRMAR